MYATVYVTFSVLSAAFSPASIDPCAPPPPRPPPNPPPTPFPARSFRCVNRSFDEICGVVCHSALISATASAAAWSVGATTPTKSPSRTTLTPGLASAAFVSAETSFALNAGGRSTLPKSIPGRRTSEAYWCEPVTIARPSTFGTDVPETVHLSAGVVRTPAAITFISFWPFVSSPKANDGLPSGPTTFPSVTESDPRPTPPCSAARSMSASRAAAAARRSRSPIAFVLWLPNVPASGGTSAVSAITTRMLLTGACNSSATACVSEVRMFCPISTFPV